jgi:hypothetical protein
VRNRFFDSETGRWSTRDKLGYVDGLSLYQYVGARSLASVDSFGLDPEPCEQEQYTVNSRKDAVRRAERLLDNCLRNQQYTHSDCHEERANVSMAKDRLREAERALQSCREWHRLTTPTPTPRPADPPRPSNPPRPTNPEPIAPPSNPRPTPVDPCKLEDGPTDGQGDACGCDDQYTRNLNKCDDCYRSAPGSAWWDCTADALRIYNSCLGKCPGYARNPGPEPGGPAGE